LSIKPGATARPSTVDHLVGRAGELADFGDLAVLDPRYRRETPAFPEPSTTSPFLTNRSYAIAHPPEPVCWRRV